MENNSDIARKRLEQALAQWQENPERPFPIQVREKGAFSLAVGDLRQKEEHWRKGLELWQSLQQVPSKAAQDESNLAKSTTEQRGWAERMSGLLRPSLVYGTIIVLIGFGIAFGLEQLSGFFASPTDRYAQMKHREVARVVFVLGDVRGQVNGRDLGLRVGMELPEGSVIQTGSKGRCDIQIGKGSMFRLKEQSQVTLAELHRSKAKGESRTDVELTLGKVLVKPKKQKEGEEFQVSTPTAVAGVRGTQFSVAVDEAKNSEVAVLEGKVNMRRRIPSLDKADRDVVDSSKVLQDLDKKMREESVEIGANGKAQVEAQQGDAVNERVAKMVELAKDARAEAIRKNPDQAQDMQKMQEQVDRELTQKLAAKNLGQDMENVNKSSQIRQQKGLAQDERKELEDFAKSADLSTQSQDKLASLELSVKPVDALVSFGGVEVGQGGFARQLSAGEYLVKAELKGYEEVERRIELSSGEKKRVVLELEQKEVELPRLTWQVSLPGSFKAVPAYGKGILVVASKDGRVYGLSRQGRKVWSYQVSGIVESSPLVHGNRVYIVNSEGRMYALSLKNGRVQWQRAVGSVVYGNRAEISGRSLFVGTAKGDLISMDLSSGKVKWVFRAKGGIFTTPLVRGNKVYFGAESGHVYAVDASSGKEVWSYASQKRIVQSRPAYGQGKLFVGTFGGSVYGLDAETGKVAWEQRVGGMIMSSLAYSAGRVYAASSNGRLMALSSQKGKVLWQRNTGGRIKSHIVERGGFVYAAVGKRVLAFNGANGGRAWTVNLSGRLGYGLASNEQGIFAVARNGKVFRMRP